MMKISCLLVLAVSICACRSNDSTTVEKSGDTAFYSEPYRPQIHFSPKENWMNDPNGMVYYEGEYHLFYQHHPESIVWGPMHWGHAISKDLFHWEQLPIALYPDSLGLIFSGSAVVDYENTSGFGTKENPAIVAIFTYHSMEKEKKGATDYQNQGIAYSIDKGRTWTKYKGNPVLTNQGIKDFRDPKVFFHRESNKWVMSLAVKDHVELWGSPDLKAWSKLSDFGREFGAHGGVWECPELVQLSVEGESTSRWVMIVSLNPGGPNGGSATQYFVGDFDGKTFTSENSKETMRWLDYGPDNYAGVTWSNNPDGRKIFLGWMSNWAYAQDVPTNPWRSAMTIARDLKLAKIGDTYFVRSSVAPEVIQSGLNVKSVSSFVLKDSIELSERGIDDISKSMIEGTVDAKDFSLTVANANGQAVVIGYDAVNKSFYIDRSKSGKFEFSKEYPLKTTAPRISLTDIIKFVVIVDVSSVEVFFDDGLSVMTSVFFPDSPMTKLEMNAKEQVTVYSLSVRQFNSIWQDLTHK